MNIAENPDDNHDREGIPFTGGRPCPLCGRTDAYILTRNGQDTVWCTRCDRFIYNAPRTETGRCRRSMRSRPDVKPSQRRRILERDSSICVRCRHYDKPLHIAHIISVNDGKKQGLSERELFDDENLVTMCEECNAGQGSETLPLPFLAMVLRVRIGRRRGREAS